MVQRDPASIESQQETEDKIRDIAIAIEIAVFAVIAKRLGKVKGKSWVDLYAAMPDDIAAIKHAIEKGRQELITASLSSLEEMAKANDEWMSFYYAAKDSKQLSTLDNPALNSVLRSAIQETSEKITSEVNTTVLGIVSKDGEMLDVEALYKRVITTAATNMASGGADYDVVSTITKKLSENGLHVFYPNVYEVREYQGAGKPVKTVIKTRTKTLTRNLYSSVCENVMGTYRRAMVDMRMIQGEEFGADAVRVSAHALCAEDHLPYQGNIYKTDKWQSIQDSLPRQFVYGSNCAHTISPVIYDIAMNLHDQAYVDKLNKLSTEKVTVTGLSGNQLTMSRYEASQYQRRIETSIRNGKEYAYLEGLRGAETESINAAIAKRTAAYRRISKEAGLSTRLDRTKLYML